MGRAVAPVRCECDVTLLEYGYENGGRQLLRHGGRGSTGGFNSRRPSYALGATLGTGTMSAYSRHPPSSCRDRHRPLRKLRTRNRRGVEEIGLGVCESAISPFQAAVDSRENRCDRGHLERTTHREVPRANTHGSAFANRKNTARRCGDDMLVRRSGYDLKVFRHWSKTAKSLATNEASKRV